MKASTLIVICIAVLVALVVMVGAKAFGLFERKPVVVDAKAKDEPILVLVANSDLHKNIAITANDVRVRELHPTEKDFYDQNRGSFLPPNVQAANLRVPADRVRADTPLRRKDFVEDRPDPLSTRIEHGMRAVTVSVPKDRCAGGLPQVGEYVDVWLTTKINDLANPNISFVRSACIAHECRIVTKRNSLFNILSADPEGAPIAFTLEANPYRAALIEYALNKGQISLQLNPTPNSRPLDPRPPEQAKMGRTFSVMESREYRDEDNRVNAVNRGELAVGDADLERIFQVTPPPAKIPPITVTRITGINPSSKVSFPREGESDTGGTVMPLGSGAPRSPLSANFGTPAGDNPGECKTCGKDQKGQALGLPVNTTVAPNASASFSSPR